MYPKAVEKKEIAQCLKFENANGNSKVKLEQGVAAIIYRTKNRLSMERVVDEEIFRDGLSLEIPSKIFLKHNVTSLRTWFRYHKK